ncbi:MAG: S1C family serine protease [Candidatus Promineifilaceae bacterium]
MNKGTYRFILFALVALLFLLAACGGGETPVEEANTPAPAATTAAEPTAVPDTPIPEPTEEPVVEETSGAINSFQDVKPAVIQIEAQGSFTDPAEGLQLNSAGRGSGFIIDDSGIAVTNNHVVTGAAFLQVWVGGNDEPLSAKILGVSECSDLAVIDIEGEGFPYLEWSDGNADVGTEIYVAGFPLGDPEYTLTRGIISKREADGDTAWSAVDHVLEYDANTNPGNSGGAVVDENGKVIAVHYAYNEGARQAFGIGADVAKQIVEQLETGTDVLAIGVNGTAINDGEGLSGIWVASVESGSPADRAGIKSGDIITKMEGLILSTDGTMSDYCNILRSHNRDDVLSVEVLRFETSELLDGQLNGRPLEASFSFAQEIAESDASGQLEEGPESYDNYVTVSDNSGAIVMEIPDHWSDLDGSEWLDDDGTVIGGTLAAAPNLSDFFETYGTPGVSLIASAGLGDSDVNDLVDFYDFTDGCTLDSRNDYEDSIYTGVFDLYNDCGDAGSIIIVLAAKPADNSHAVVIEAQAITDADIDALDHVLDTFNVVGTLPGT